MTITKKYLRDLEKSARISFTGKQQQIILERFGTNPYPYEWSEQDIQVQIGNYLHCGHWEKQSIRCCFGEKLPSGVKF